MVWIQVWTDPQEFIRSDTIVAVSYRIVKQGKSEDIIEVIAQPSGKIILKVPVNAGKYPANEHDQKTWQMLVNARALQVMGEVTRVISETEPKGKIISLKDLVAFDFELEAPKDLDIEVWVWELPCHNCEKQTPVVYPVGSFFGFMLEFNFLKNLPVILAERYPFYTKKPAKGRDGDEFHNSCVHCGHAQPDWRVMESYLEVVNTPGLVKEKVHITVPLTETEQEEYRKAGISSSW